LTRVLLLFVDGVGLGDDDAACNPFVAARLPHLGALLDGRRITRDAAPFHASDASLVAVDATLGHDGIPQSGTGQAALLTGANAVTMHGRHFGPWVPARLQRLVREESVLAGAQAAGCSIAFANAYPEEVLQLVAAGERAAGLPPGIGRRDRKRSADDSVRGDDDARGAVDSGTVGSSTGDTRSGGSAAARRRRTPTFLRAGPPLAALGAGVLTRHTAALERGEAVASEITNDGWRATLGRMTVPVIAAEQAGRNLAAIAAAHRLTLFAHYATDYAGHRRDMSGAIQSLERLDAFIGGIVSALPDDALLFLVSDHGNIEDVRTGHTRNPALGMVVGKGHALLSRRLESLMDVTPTILDVLSL
jgi:2,3-bisphosphoglycerate-independent phosphoglycerate mutase